MTRPVSPAVDDIVRTFGDRLVTVREIVEAILARHAGDYAGGKSRLCVPEWPAVSRADPIAAWLAQIDAFWQADAFSELFGRGVILGAALCDPSCGRAMDASGLFHQIALELRPPLGEALSQTGRAAIVSLPLAAALAQVTPPRMLPIAQPGRPIALSSDSRYVAASEPRTNDVVVWDVRRGQQIRREHWSSPIEPTGLWLNHHGSVLAMDVLGILEVRPPLATPVVPAKVDIPLQVMWCAFSNLGDVLAVASAHDISVYSLPDGSLQVQLKCPNVVHVAVHGHRVLAGSSDGRLRSWQLPSGEELFSTDSRGASILSVALPPTDTQVASGDDNGTVNLWDVMTGSALASGEQTDPVRGLAFSADGRLLASGGDDGSVRLWRVDNMVEIGRLPHGSHVWDVAFDASGTELQSTANDGITRRWVIGTDQPLAPAYLADQVDTQPGATWIDDDVDAFARLIASRHMSPPLSIAVFGEWGAGKTFFMRRVQQRVGRLGREARESRLMQRDVGYYKHIAQVEFNAWHYSNADLWASLVDNLFTRLSFEGDEASATERRVRALFEDANKRDLAEIRTASMEVRWLEQEHTLALNEVSNIEDREKQVQTQLGELQVAEQKAAESFVRSLSGDTLIALSEAGYGQLGTTPAQVIASIQAARRIAGEAKWWAALVRSPDRYARLAWMVGAAALALGVGIIVYFAVPLSEALKSVLAPLVSVLGLAAAGFRWLQQQADWLHHLRAGVDAADRQAQTILGPQATELEAKKTAAIQQLALVEAELASARDRQTAAMQRRHTREDEIQSGNPAALFARLVGDRAESDYYRKHLGLLSLIRRDFEAISDFVERDRLSLEDLTLTPAAEQRADQTRVNRIVLYIDDLDRCPPNVVVNVLEAIHLLLSFPLFVVVVGVDARWVSRALTLKYPDLLPDDATKPGASPLDYLEKIFQVPFWVEPLEASRVKQLMETLLGSRATPTSAAPIHSPSSGVNGAGGASGAGGGAGAGGASHAGAPRAHASGTPAEDLSARTMELTDLERDVLDEIAALLVRSPRALKRFLNLYRLIRTKAFYDGFVDNRGPSSDFRVVMFLLAVVTSEPDGANALFDELERPAAPAERLLGDLINAACLVAPRLQPVADWLQRPENAAWSSLTEVPLQRWWREVIRYSFRPRHVRE